MTKREMEELIQINYNQEKALQDLFYTITNLERALSIMKQTYNEYRSKFEYRKKLLSESHLEE